MKLTSQELSKVIIGAARESFGKSFNEFLQACKYENALDKKWKNYDELNSKLIGSMSTVQILINNIDDCEDDHNELSSTVRYLNNLKIGYLLLANHEESLCLDWPMMYPDEQIDKYIKLTQNF